MNILIVEDDEDMAVFLQEALEEEGYMVDTAPNGKVGVQKATINNYDLIIMDNHMPEKNGKQACHEIRDIGKTMPILMLSVVGDIATKVDMLSIGADDYMTKPFAFSEFMARVKALLRRPVQMKQVIYSVGELVLDVGKHEVKLAGKEIVLTAKEFSLLECLMSQRGRVVSRMAILEHIWGVNADPLTNTIETHIVNLRTKLGDRQKELIHTVVGLGYKIV